MSLYLAVNVSLTESNPRDSFHCQQLLSTSIKWIILQLTWALIKSHCYFLTSRGGISPYYGLEGFFISLGSVELLMISEGTAINYLISPFED
jgi:hypothetical protein